MIGHFNFITLACRGFGKRFLGIKDSKQNRDLVPDILITATPVFAILYIYYSREGCTPVLRRGPEDSAYMVSSAREVNSLIPLVQLIDIALVV